VAGVGGLFPADRMISPAHVSSRDPSTSAATAIRLLITQGIHSGHPRLAGWTPR
jgi:hypothetical protein